MKKLWLLLLFGVLGVLVSAVPIKDVTLEVGESFLFENKNITLIDSADESVILCINNEKFIVSKDKRISGVFVDYKRSDDDKATLRFKYECNEDNCECGDECSNSLCFENIVVEDEVVDEVVEGIVECREHLECNGGDECTVGVCSSNSCVFTEIPGCGETIIEEEVVEGTLQDNSDIRPFAFVLLFIALILAIIMVIRMFIDKK